MTRQTHGARLNISADAQSEVADVLRRLMRTPWLVGGRDDELISAVRRNQEALQTVLQGRLGWSLLVERDLVRLRKTPPARLEDWTSHAPTPQACSWTFLFAAAAESLAHKVTLAQMVEAGRVVAAEAGIPVVEGRTLRQAHAAALRELIARGLLEESDGDLDAYVEDEGAQVLLTVFHTRLEHLIANWTTAFDPATEPEEWLEAVRRDDAAPRRMRRLLVDDTVVHTADLDAEEADWFSRRLRGDDAGPLAAAFGVTIERRAEGAAFVVPDDLFRWDKELGDVWFPKAGAAGHAALLLCDHLLDRGQQPTADNHGPGTGWCGLPHAEVAAQLEDIVGRGRGAWPRAAVENVAGLLDEAQALLTAMGLLRRIDDWWWVSPAAGRWEAPANPVFIPDALDDTTGDAAAEAAGGAGTAAADDADTVPATRSTHTQATLLDLPEDQ
ncbi:DUF2398 family protein [Puerhibacterium sp. TATVAM-FAB25]|uniref:DUF2398 family protein n=1 Tax=Puerhibacterium sp. TATVAM-FAB25 TaxID=3093699 RepID=UPI00397DBCCE